ncbi:MAG: glycosyltransferase family 2 protein [bacterium]|nr:glycosyltransferase family 2 protein [bacterium]
MKVTDAGPPKLSVITLTKNSERTIDKTLNSIYGWADEIIIIDSRSEDRTIEIAKKFGCKVFHKELQGFGEQKSYGVAQSSNDWVMIVDSDEVVTDELKNEISAKLVCTEPNGFNVPITLVFMGRVMRYGREYKMPHLRLFNKKYGDYNSSKVHEDVELKGEAGSLENHILHYSYADLNEYFKKFNHYTSLAAQDLKSKGRRTNTFEIAIRFPIQFFQTYFLHLNFLNGYPGFIWSLCSAFYPVIKLAKLKELTTDKQL